MHKSKKAVSRNIGVEIGAICSKYFLKSQHLHYGYWTSDLEVDIANLRIAQENYARFLISRKEHLGCWMRIRPDSRDVF
jgi:hypothetical protein